jgi:hypothetical protein
MAKAPPLVYPVAAFLGVRFHERFEACLMRPDFRGADVGEGNAVRYGDVVSQKALLHTSNSREKRLCSGQIIATDTAVESRF